MRAEGVTKQVKLLIAVVLIILGLVSAWAFDQFGGESVSDAPHSIADSQPSRAKLAVPTELVDVVALEQLAVDACFCTRSGADEDTCWKSYRTATEDFEIENLVSASEPVSYEVECIATDDGEKCVAKGYWLSGASDSQADAMLCTAAEAKAIEQAFADAFSYVEDQPGGSNYSPTEQAQQSIAQILDRIRSGEKFKERPQPVGGI